MFARTRTSWQKLRNSVTIPRVARFGQEEEGSITVFGVMMFVLMVGIGGIAIDIMRYETQRVQLQYTLDRAVLAAAARDQEEDAAAVIRGYFEASGLENYRLSIDPEEGFNYRRVSAQAEMDINSIFMQMFGIDSLTSPAFGVAEDSIPNIEVSMVLDVSGSMGRNSRIQNMRPAAREFVNLVMQANDYENDEMTVSVSIVPYNGRVNAGSTIESVFTLSNEHDRSSCTRFSPADFQTTAIDPSQTIERLAHFDLADDDIQWNMDYTWHRNSHCQTDDTSAILPWSHDIAELHAHINSLQASGWTAIDLGMNWGVGLLDPAAAPAVSQLITAGTVHEDFSDRPLPYPSTTIDISSGDAQESNPDNDTLKVVVLMTDGENTNQYDVVQDRKSGDSNIFYHEEDDRWSIYMPDTELYWIPNRRQPNWGGIGRSRPNSWNGVFSVFPYRGDESEAVSWQYIWRNWSARMVAGEFYYRGGQLWGGDWDYYQDLRYDSYERYADADQADDNLEAICDAAREANILVFTIAYEAPPRGVSAMQYCATTPSHYYEVRGAELGDALASIAETINRLRLVQ